MMYFKLYCSFTQSILCAMCVRKCTRQKEILLFRREVLIKYYRLIYSKANNCWNVKMYISTVAKWRWIIRRNWVRKIIRCYCFCKLKNKRKCECESIRRMAMKFECILVWKSLECHFSLRTKQIKREKNRTTTKKSNAMGL